MAGLDPVSIFFFEKYALRRLMDTRVKPAYDNGECRNALPPILHDRIALFRLRKLRRRLAGDLPECVRKRRHTRIAEVRGELLDRDIGLRRKSPDRRRDPRALAPALEAQLRLRRKQPRQRPRRRSDLARQRLDLMRTSGVAQDDVRRAPAARLMRQRNEGYGILGVMQFKDG